MCRSGRSEPSGPGDHAARLVGMVGAGMRDHRVDQVGANHQHVGVPFLTQPVANAPGNMSR